MVIRDQSFKRDVLDFHSMNGRPGKVSLLPTKPLLTQRDLTLAYSPGVALPCLEITNDSSKAYAYTSRGNYVAVVSNGTAVLGLGNIGPLAAKPVMEGKAVLFKRFADLDAVDIEIDTEDVDEFINAVRYLAPSWGGINLEDIKAPDCFIVEERLQSLVDIPVMHDDQHGTAIIIAAALINALDVVGKSMDNIKVVFSGSGAAGIASLKMLRKIGVPKENVVMCDQNGVLYKGRMLGMDSWKEDCAIETSDRTLSQALRGADVFIGLSVRGVVSVDMIMSMNKNPVIFALANPDPEIHPSIIASARSDSVFATGRSDYCNQVNNLMGFPYIFRGAMDVRATAINYEMKIAAAESIAALAREAVTEEVRFAYGGKSMSYGPSYIIPTPFDSRLVERIPAAVAHAAIESGVARSKIEDLSAYSTSLRERLSPIGGTLNSLFVAAKRQKKRVIFADGEEEVVIKVALQWRDSEYGEAVLVGRQDKIMKSVKKLEISNLDGISIVNAANSKNNEQYIDYAYKKLQRCGYLRRSCVRLVKTDRNVFASCMLAFGHGDLLVSGFTRNYYDTLADIQKIIDQRDIIFGLSIIIMKHKTVFIADSAIHENPSSEVLAKIAKYSALALRKLEYPPRIAFVSYSNFGARSHTVGDPQIMGAINILENEEDVDFEFDGELNVSVALDYEAMKSQYSFCRLTGPANLLIMPGLHSANIASQLLTELGGGYCIGPILLGLEKPVQIASVFSSVSDLLYLAVLGSST